MKLHQKGYLLVELHRSGTLWDADIVARAFREYGFSGAYWERAIRIALEELAAAGLIARTQSKLRGAGGLPGVSFAYALTDFGRTRMVDTGLLAEAGA